MNRIFLRLSFFLMTAMLAQPGEAQEPKNEKAVFAAGCFWCIQPPYDELKGKGVVQTIVGYAGGHTENPTYEQTNTGTTGHREVIEVTYDPQKVSYERLLEIFWKNHDPHDARGQFCDKGDQYRAAIYYSDEKQKKVAEESKVKYGKILKREIVTEIKPYKAFYKGEDYHQEYYLKNPVKYKFYRYNCGRDKRLEEVWGKSR